MARPKETIQWQKKDPRVTDFCLEENTIWEDGNRVEPRYHNFGQVVDYCGMKPEDFANRYTPVKNISETENSN